MGFFGKKKGEEDAELGLSQEEKDLIEAINRCSAPDPAPEEENEAKEEKPADASSSFFGQTGIFSKTVGGIKDGVGNVFAKTAGALTDANGSGEKSEKIDLDEKLKSVIEEYNIEYNQLNDNGAGLLRYRERAGDLLEMVEALINSIANRPKSFDADISEIRVHRTEFKHACDFAQDELRAAQTSAISAGGGILGGVAVAALMPTTAMWVATTFGTASTGALISTLSGAAANSAALAWLGGGALAAGGGGMTAGSAFLALAGPIGWTIGGATLLASVALFVNKKFKIDKERKEEIESVIKNTHAVRMTNAQLRDLAEKTSALRAGLAKQFLECMQSYGKNFPDIAQDDQLHLGALVNNAKALSITLGVNVREQTGADEDALSAESGEISAESDANIDNNMQSSESEPNDAQNAEADANINLNNMQSSESEPNDAQNAEADANINLNNIQTSASEPNEAQNAESDANIDNNMQSSASEPNEAQNGASNAEFASIATHPQDPDQSEAFDFQAIGALADTFLDAKNAEKLNGFIDMASKIAQAANAEGSEAMTQWIDAIQTVGSEVVARSKTKSGSDAADMVGCIAKYGLSVVKNTIVRPDPKNNEDAGDASLISAVMSGDPAEKQALIRVGCELIQKNANGRLNDLQKIISVEEIAEWANSDEDIQTKTIRLGLQKLRAAIGEKIDDSGALVQRLEDREQDIIDTLQSDASSGEKAKRIGAGIIDKIVYWYVSKEHKRAECGPFTVDMLDQKTEEIIANADKPTESPLSGIDPKDENETRGLTTLYGFVRQFFENNVVALDIIQDHAAQTGRQTQPGDEKAIDVGADADLPPDAEETGDAGADADLPPDAEETGADADLPPDAEETGDAGTDADLPPDDASHKTRKWPTAPIGRTKDTNIKSDLREVRNAAFLEGKYAFCNAVKMKLDSGKLLTDLTCDDWFDIARESGFGAVKGGVMTASFYLMTHYVAAPAEIANSVTTAVYGIAQQAFLFRTGQIDELAFVKNSGRLSVEAAVDILSCVAGRFDLPIPIIGITLNKSAVQVMYRAARDGLAAKEQRLLEQYALSIRETENKLKEKHRIFLEALQRGLEKFMEILDRAFSSDPQTAFSGSAELARACGVPCAEILDTADKIRPFFMA